MAKSLAERVNRIILNQAVDYLPDALSTLHKIVQTGDSESVKVQAARTLINAVSTASEGMTEEQAGRELMELVKGAEYRAEAKTEVPDAFRE